LAIFVSYVLNIKSPSLANGVHPVHFRNPRIVRQTDLIMLKEPKARQCHSNIYFTLTTPRKKL